MAFAAKAAGFVYVLRKFAAGSVHCAQALQGLRRAEIVVLRNVCPQMRCQLPHRTGRRVLSLILPNASKKLISPCASTFSASPERLLL